MIIDSAEKSIAAASHAAKIACAKTSASVQNQSADQYSEIPIKRHMRFSAWATERRSTMRHYDYDRYGVKETSHIRKQITV